MNIRLWLEIQEEKILIEKLDLVIWGRNFTLPVKYDCYTGESITTSQIRAMEVFSEHLDWINNSEDIVRQYCQSDVLSDPNNTKKENVFSYLKPESIFVKRTS